MSSGDYRAQVEELLEQAANLEHGQAQYDLTEQAVRLADLHGDEDLGFTARQDLFNAAGFSDHYDVLLVHYAWALSRCDRDPERFPIEDVLWNYKWVVHAAPEFPRIPAAQIDGLVEDLDRRFQKMNAGERTIEYLRMRVAAKMGRMDLAREHLAVWPRIERDWWSDCPACEADTLVDTHASLRQDEEAIEASKCIVQGRLTCAEVPQRTSGDLMRPHFRTGRLDEAATLHRRWYPKIKDNRNFLPAVSQHMEFLALTLNLARAAQLFEHHFDWSIDSPNAIGRLYFYTVSSQLFRLLGQQGRERIALRLPRRWKDYREDGEYQTAALFEAMSAQAAELAQALDERNGNTFYSEEIKEAAALADRAVNFSVAAKRKPKSGSKSKDSGKQA